MFGQISLNGKLIMVNLEKVCAITDEYIQFDDGHVIYGDVDLNQALYEVSHFVANWKAMRKGKD
jgi:riboflavin synthase alpha subunit